jgi:sigma-B regulation protein RsbU (phosphoserine phosphatase)
LRVATVAIGAEALAMKVLIADDDLVGRAILEHALRQWRYEVVNVRDGLAAWELLQQADAPPIAILDWMMPELDGPELCRRVRTLQRTTPVYLILLTSKTLKRDVVRGLEHGADDFIAKPFDVGELRSRLKVGERVIARHQQLFDRVRELEAALALGRSEDAIPGDPQHCNVAI